jgi:hypothetical protein
MQLFVFKKIFFLVLGSCLVCNSVQSVQAQPLVLDTTRLHVTSTESPPFPTPIYIGNDEHRSGFFKMLKQLLERVRRVDKPTRSEPSSPVVTAPAPTPVPAAPAPQPVPSTPPPVQTVSEAPAAPATPIPSAGSGTLAFTAMEGGSSPNTQTFTITNNGGGTLNWTLNDNASWLTLSPTSGTTTTELDVVTVSVDITGLSSNTYNGAITLSSQGQTLTSQQIPVTLILAPTTPTIGQSPTSLTFTGMEGGSTPSTQTLNITNPGKGTLNWTATEVAPWLTISPATGTTMAETDKITVTVNTSGLTAKTYTTTITVGDPAASNNAQQIPVTLALTAPQSGTATLTWEPNGEADLAGYKVYIGSAPGSYLPATDIGNTTTHKVVVLPGKTYYFAVTAYNTAGESGYSNETSKTMP